MPLISVHHKSFPPSAWGTDAAAFVASGPPLSGFATPLLTLDSGALHDNVEAMMTWLGEHGVRIAPHGKTSMAPALWRALLDAGAWGLTLATGWQAQVARAHGVRRIIVANEMVDPVALRWAADELDRAPHVQIMCWADDVATVRAMERVLTDRAPGRPLPVIVELGADGGRTGARDRDVARAVADAIAASPVLVLAGVGGYEGALARDREPASLARVDGYLRELAALHRDLLAVGRYPAGARPVVTAGGSAYFDRVVDVLAPLADTADVVLRSGAFQIHDDGHYAGISPMGRQVGTRPFRAAMHMWARAVSRPEPDLVLLDCGKRDVSFDQGMPVPQRIVGRDASTSAAALAGSAVTALNDQHAFLRLGAGAVASGAADVLAPGAVVRLGLSHPCTVLDRWRLIPVVDDADRDEPTVVDTVETWF